MCDRIWLVMKEDVCVVARMLFGLSQLLQFSLAVIARQLHDGAHGLPNVAEDVGSMEKN